MGKVHRCTTEQRETWATAEPLSSLFFLAEGGGPEANGTIPNLLPACQVNSASGGFAVGFLFLPGYL